jgi:uncharacterized protein
MLVVLSPAKNLDFSPPSSAISHTQPVMLSEAETLVKQCRKLSPAQLSSLMHISDKLAGLNADRFASWQTPFSSSNAKQAILAFNGEVYAGLEANSFSESDLAFAQQHLRILSGLYGVLKPLDLMQAYRLEMGTKLANRRGTDLYAYWGTRITQVLNQAIDEHHAEVLINLASNEYFKAVKPKLLKAPIITPVFQDEKNGQYKVISFFAKKARGLMARFIIQERVNKLEQLREFCASGYRFEASQSSSQQLVFRREEQ